MLSLSDLARAEEKELVAIIPVSQLQAVTDRVKLIQQSNNILEQTLKARKTAQEAQEQEVVKLRELVGLLEDQSLKQNQLQAATVEDLRQKDLALKEATFWRNAVVVGSVAVSVVPAFRWVRLLVGR